MSKVRRRFALPEWLAISLFLLGLTTFLVHVDWLWRWDQLLYDVQLRFWSRSPPEDIVIVAIDDASLAELGRWPWPRRVHAGLVKQLSNAGARAIALDILFAEPDEQDPQSDAALTEAVAASGRVVLPIVIEEFRQGGQLVETLPFPALAAAAASLGHVHVDLDPDGIARRAYLLEGLAGAYWPSLSVALLRMIEPDGWRDLPGVLNPNPIPAPHSPYGIVRDHQIFIPFAGPPGHFPRYSYSQVLRGDYLADAFRDKIVLVGFTATGLGDILPTPVSAHSQPMPGVEINANLIDALRQGMTLELLATPWRLLLSGLIVLLPAFLFPRLTPRAVLLATGLLLVATVELSAALLSGFHLWFPPFAALLGVGLSYPLWSWRRLDHTMRYLKQELEQLHSEPDVMPFYGRSLPISRGLKFLRRIIPLDGWVLRDDRGHVLSQWGRVPDEPAEEPTTGAWLEHQRSLWTTIPREQGAWVMGFQWGCVEGASAGDKRLLMEFLQQFTPAPRRSARNTTELIENRIQQVQAATHQLRTMRRFISDTLGQMSDGLLVVNPAGRVVFANNRAALFLADDPEADLASADVMTLLAKVEIQGAITWTDALRSVLVERSVVRFEGRHGSGSDLLIQMAPLALEGDKLHGLILNLSDISLLKHSERKRAEALSFLSHDLRSPITSLLALVQLCRQESGALSTEELTSRVEHYAQKALRLAEDFLQLARAENASEATFDEIDLVTVAHNAVDEAYPEARAKNIKLRRHIEVDEAWLRGDAVLLERALMNLLGNAIKYCPQGATVGLCLTGDQEGIQCCVEDTGPGIPASELNRVFDRFHRVDSAESRDERGLGLGLAFVKVVADKHGGTVDVHSAPGKGSRFCLILATHDVAA